MGTARWKLRGRIDLDLSSRKTGNEEEEKIFLFPSCERGIVPPEFPEIRSPLRACETAHLSTTSFGRLLYPDCLDHLDDLDVLG